MVRAFIVSVGLALAIYVESPNSEPLVQEISAPPHAANEQRRNGALGDRLPAGAIARLGSTRLRYHRDVQHVVFAPDGKLLACSDFRGKVFFFNAVTGERRAMQVAEGACGPVVFS